MISMLCFALLPALLAAEFTCPGPDGVICPDGKICCFGDDQKVKCCDINTKGSRKLIPGVKISSTFNSSLLSEKQESSVICHLTCRGTCCGDNCCDGHYSANCCLNPKQCCPFDHECCNEDFCCPPDYVCSSILDICVARTSTFTSSLATLAFLLLLSKTLVQ